MDVHAITGQLFRHIDGGFYRFVTVAFPTNGTPRQVVYTHVWPFEAVTFVRPLDGWPYRFIPATDGELHQAQAFNRDVAQAMVHLARTLRQAALTSSAAVAGEPEVTRESPAPAPAHPRADLPVPGRIPALEPFGSTISGAVDIPL